LVSDRFNGSTHFNSPFLQPHLATIVNKVVLESEGKSRDNAQRIRRKNAGAECDRRRFFDRTANDKKAIAPGK